jgi:NADH dehydrogenase
VYAETWLDLIGRPLVETGRTRIFGEGRNPIDFVAVDDVAAVTEAAAFDPALRGATIDVAGTEPASMLALVDLVRAATGVDGRVGHVPRGMLRVMSRLLRPVRPVLADQMATALAMDTRPMVAPPAARSRPDPAMPVTPLRIVAERVFADERERDRSSVRARSA